MRKGMILDSVSFLLEKVAYLEMVNKDFTG